MMRKFPNMMRYPFFAPEDGGGGGGGGDGDAAAAAAAAAAQGAWTPPDFVPETFRGATAEETLERLATGYTEADQRATGLRDKLAKLPAAPKTPDEYTFEPGEKLKPYFGGDLGEDPAFKSARAAAHKHGLSQDQFAGFIADVYAPLIEGGQLPPPYDGEAEFNTYIKARKLDDRAGAALIESNAQFAKGLFAQLKDVPENLANDVRATLETLADTAAGNVLLEAISGRLNENGIRVAGEGGQGGAMTEAELRQMAGDPRIDPANRDNPDTAKRFDPALRERYDAAHKALSSQRKSAF